MHLDRSSKERQGLNYNKSLTAGSVLVGLWVKSASSRCTRVAEGLCAMRNHEVHQYQQQIHSYKRYPIVRYMRIVLDVLQTASTRGMNHESTRYDCVKVCCIDERDSYTHELALGTSKHK